LELLLSAVQENLGTSKRNIYIILSPVDSPRSSHYTDSCMARRI